MPIIRSRSLRHVVFFVVALVGSIGAYAQNSTWRPSGGGEWNEPAKWFGPVPNGPTADAFVGVFPSRHEPRPVIDLPAALTLRSLAVYSQQNVLEFGRRGTELQIAPGGFVELGHRDEGGLDFKASISGDGLEISTDGPVRLSGDLSSPFAVRLNARSSMAVTGNIRSPTIDLDFRGGGPSNVQLAGSLVSFVDEPESSWFSLGSVGIRADGDSKVRVDGAIQTGDFSVDLGRNGRAQVTLGENVTVIGSASFALGGGSLVAPRVEARVIELSGETGSVAHVGLSGQVQRGDFTTSGVLRFTSVEDAVPSWKRSLSLNMPSGTERGRSFILTHLAGMGGCRELASRPMTSRGCARRGVGDGVPRICPSETTRGPSDGRRRTFGSPFRTSRLRSGPSVARGPWRRSRAGCRSAQA